jgi:hypothetical protein
MLYYSMATLYYREISLCMPCLLWYNIDSKSFYTSAVNFHSKISTTRGCRNMRKRSQEESSIRVRTMHETVNSFRVFRLDLALSHQWHFNRILGPCCTSDQFMKQGT